MFSTRFKTQLVLLITLTLLVTVGKSESKLISSLQSGTAQTVVAYGTSLTANGAWVEHLEAALEASYPEQCTLINSGGAGKNSQWGLAHLEGRVLQHQPDTVFLEFSINDAVARFNLSVAAAQANLETMIDRILVQNPNCEIILMTMTPGDKYPEDHRSYRQNIEGHYKMYQMIAKDRGFRLIDHYSNWKQLQSTDPTTFKTYVPDSIHPTATGNSQIVTPVILEALGIQISDHQH